MNINKQSTIDGQISMHDMDCAWDYYNNIQDEEALDYIERTYFNL